VAQGGELLTTDGEDGVGVGGGGGDGCVGGIEEYESPPKSAMTPYGAEGERTHILLIVVGVASYEGQ
jgi:hypothetical protein